MKQEQRRGAAPPAVLPYFLLPDVLPPPLLVPVLPPPVLLPTFDGLAVPPLIVVPALPMPLEPDRLLEPLCPVEP